MKAQLLHIFLETGRTYTFRNAKIIQDNETALVFEYKAMSDGRQKRATFYKGQIVGFSVYVEDDDLPF